MKMNKKGYTLLEIIIVLGIITIIGVGSIVGVNIVNNKKIEKFYDKFDDALSVYLETHNEVYTNLKENVEGSVITLEVLKNEGLISDNLIDPEGNKIDYENNYYVLSSAKLLDNEEDEEESTDVCEGQVSIEVIKSWETLKDKVDTGNVIYICPKNSDNDDDKDYEDLLKRIQTLESALALMSTDNNYVLFGVTSDSSEIAYWPKDNEDIWRYYEYNGNWKLMYDQAVGVNQYMDIVNLTPSDFEASKESDLTKPNNTTFWTSSKGSANCYYQSDEDEVESCKSYTLYRLNSNNCYGGDFYLIYNGTTRIGFFRKSTTSASMYVNGAKTKTKVSYHPAFNISLNDLSSNYYCKRTGSGDDYYQVENGFSLDDLTSTDNSVKKQVLLNNMSYKDSLKSVSWEYGYKVQLESLVPTEDSDSYNSPLGNMTMAEANTIVSSGKSWLIGKNFVIGYYRYSSEKHLAIISSGYNSQAGLVKEKYSDGKYSLTTADYYPVIALKANIILETNTENYKNITGYKKKYSTCFNDDNFTGTLGSKDCPYILKDNSSGNYLTKGLDLE